MIPNKRVLTLKSKLGFGKHRDETIGHIIETNKKFYLAWVYYNNDIIDFNDEIKNIVGITTELSIPKPGKCPSIYDANKNMFQEIVAQKEISEESLNKQKRFREGISYKTSKSSKFELARKNQGKI
jgi:hypothetical protein